MTKSEELERGEKEVKIVEGFVYEGKGCRGCKGIVRVGKGNGEKGQGRV
jgi:hypothetical protein